MRRGPVAGSLGSMFIAIRDLRFARGRFALLGGVIALMTLMVVLLSGLTAGLGHASVSAVEALPVDAIAFQEPTEGQDPAFATSALPADADAAYEDAPEVDSAHPIGIATNRIGGQDSAAAVTLIGADAALLPPVEQGRAPGHGEVAVTAELADEESLAVGDSIDIAGQGLEVAGTTEATSFNHLPVVYTDLGTWRDAARAEGMTAVGLTGDDIAATPGTVVVSRTEAFDAVGGYASEQASLNLMRALLLGISALIVGAFFTVWTMQRTPDLAVVRAMGASRGYLLRDALAQAGIVLVFGAAVGGAAAAGIGALAASVMPFVLNAATFLAPIGAMVVVGAIGAAVSVRRITAVDPVTALGAAR